jgi:hypothetical protein
MWVGVLTIAAVYPFLVRSDDTRRRDFFLSGSLIALAGLIKFLYLGLGLPLLVAAVIGTSAKGGYRFRVDSRLAFSALGLLLPLLLVGTYLQVGGVLGDYFQVHFEYPRDSYANLSQASLMQRLRGLLMLLWTATPGGGGFQGVALAVPLMGLGLYRLWKEDRRRLAIVGAWGCAAAFIIGLQARFYTYHWSPLIPVLVLLATVGFAEAQGRGRSIGRVAKVLVFILMCQLSIRPLIDSYRASAYAAGITDEKSYYKEMNDGIYNVYDEIQAARYIERRTDADDPVVIFGNNADLLVLAKRRSPTRFIHSLPLSNFPGKHQRRYRAEFIRDLKREPPAVIVIGITWSFNTGAVLRGFPAFTKMIERDYQRTAAFGAIRIYERKGMPIK